jgi:hypothetical protein
MIHFYVISFQDSTFMIEHMLNLFDFLVFITQAYFYKIFINEMVLLFIVIFEYVINLFKILQLINHFCHLCS